MIAEIKKCTELLEQFNKAKGYLISQERFIKQWDRMSEYSAIHSDIQSVLANLSHVDSEKLDKNYTREQLILLRKRLIDYEGIIAELIEITADIFIAYYDSPLNDPDVH